MTLKDLSNKINEVLVGMKSMKHSIDEINVRLDRLEKDVAVLKSDVALIKSCPTIKKEISELNSSK